RYAYVYNDPQNLVDPSGHVPALYARIGLGLMGAAVAGAGLFGLNQALPPNWWTNRPPNCACTNPDAVGPLDWLTDLRTGIAATALSLPVLREAGVEPFDVAPLKEWQKPHGMNSSTRSSGNSLP
ncbi:hypothetical protein HC891_03155, partial [Candidatus Gracilibacteria bacterium]|nr:hypothetical protein [Candidatus Gracilibacteria bacterium]